MYTTIKIELMLTREEMAVPVQRDKLIRVCSLCVCVGGVPVCVCVACVGCGWVVCGWVVCVCLCVCVRGCMYVCVHAYVVLLNGFVSTACAATPTTAQLLDCPSPRIILNKRT